MAAPAPQGGGRDLPPHKGGGNLHSWNPKKHKDQIPMTTTPAPTLPGAAPHKGGRGGGTVSGARGSPPPMAGGGFDYGVSLATNITRYHPMHSVSPGLN